MIFNEWLNEGENWSVRRERMLEDIQVDPDNMNSLFKWLEAAYNVGYDEGHHEGLMKG